MQTSLSSRSLTSNPFYSFNEKKYCAVAQVINRRIWLSKDRFKQIKKLQHQIVDELANKHKYRAGLRATLHELINVCDHNFTSRVSQETLAQRSNCTNRTIRNHLERFEQDGLISSRKNGWKQTNTITLLFAQHLNYNKEESFSYNLTPPDCALKGSNLWGSEEYEKRDQDADSAASYGRATAEEQNIWDDEIDFEPKEEIKITKEYIEEGKRRMKDLQILLFSGG